MAASLCLLAGCRQPGAPGRADTGATSRAAPAPAPRLLDGPPLERTVPMVLLPARGRPVQLNVELAVSESARMRGLMFRKALPPDRGMLFVFPRDGDWPFYMRNTYVALDLVYLDARGRVVGVLPDMQPLDETPRSVGKPARYVLEVRAGSVAAWGLAPGDLAELPPLH